jgi:flavin reductase (DIM6/NTAB) family NADH-FMN oxidoreductase RutF
MPVEPTDFTRAMALVPGPVAVATTVGPTGRRWGFTGSSFSSLSMDPPLVLICLDKQASTHDAFTSADHFMINILAYEQADVALRFAKSGVDRFEAGDMEPCELGLPGLSGASARVACALHDVIDGGDHTILVGRVEATFTGNRAPLVYCERAFTHPVPAHQLAGAAAR